jgi:type IV pilus assembly PilN-like protein
VRAVNLLPRDDPRGGPRQHDPVMIGGVAAVVAVTAIIAALFLASSAGVADKQKRFDAAQSELDSTPVPPPAPEGNSALAQDKGQRIAALSAALSKRLAWDRVFRELSLVLPEDVWLSTLSAKAPDAAAAPGAPSAGFTINGQTYSHDGVARLLARLALVPHLTGVQLQHSARAVSESGRPVVEFSIVASVKAPGAA